MFNRLIVAVHNKVEPISRVLNFMSNDNSAGFYFTMRTDDFRGVIANNKLSVVI